MAGSSLIRDEILKLVEWQLGRKPAIIFKAVVDCDYGWPAVLECAASTADSEPNPNLYYLSCPFLRRETARLEDGRFNRDLQKLADNDPLMAKSLKEAQEKHKAEWMTAVEKESIEVTARDMTAWAACQGMIAGSNEPGHLKCLHAHLAFFLVHRDYLLGREIMKALDSLWCGDERCGAFIAEMRRT